MFQFEVHGVPKPQEQMQFACDCPPKSKCKKWAYNPCSKDIETIRWQVRPFAPTTPFSSAVEFTAAFFMPIPKSASKALRQQMVNRVVLPDKTPDDDNMSYLITNALKGVVYDDDKRICVRHIYKFYGEEPKTVIRVRPIQQCQPMGFRLADDI